MKTNHYRIACTFIAMVMAIFMLNVELTSAYVILMPIGHQLHLSTNQLSWVISSYLLGFSALIAIAGRLGDLFGHRETLLVGLLIFACSSFLAGLSHHLSELLIARTFQGIGAALLWPNASVILFNLFPKQKNGLAIGIVTSIVGFTLATGPIIGGTITHFAEWRWVFWFNTPLAIFVFFVTYFFTQHSLKQKKLRIDYLGAMLMTFISIFLTLSIKQIVATAPWHHFFLLLLLITILLLRFFLWYEKKINYAIIPSALIQNKRFILSCAMRFFTVMPFYIVLMFMTLYFQKNFHLSPYQSGLDFLPMTLSIGLFSPVAGRLIDYFGANVILIIAGIIYFTGFLLFYFFDTTRHTIFIANILILPGIAFALASSAALSLGLSVAPEKTKGAATGVFYMVSIISGLVGVTTCSVVLSQHYQNGRISVYAVNYILYTLLALSLVIVASNLPYFFKKN